MIRRHLYRSALTLALVLLPLALPAQEKSASVVKYMPSSDAVFFMEFDGLNSQSAAWQKTDLYGLLNKTLLRNLVDDIALQIQAIAKQAMNDAQSPELTQGMIDGLAEALTQEGGGLSVHWREGAKEPQVVIALPNILKHGRGQGKLSTLFQNMIQTELMAGRIKVEKNGSRQVIKPTDRTDITLINDTDDVVFLFGDSKAAMAAIEGREPNLQSHARFRALSKPNKTFKPILRAFLDISAIPLPPEAKALGLDGLKQIEARMGFEANQLRSECKVLAPAPRKGILSLLDTPALDKASLANVPSDATSFTAISFDPAGIMAKAGKLGETVQPGMEANMEKMQDDFRQKLGFDLKTNLLELIGPVVVYGTKKASSEVNAAETMFVSVQVKSPQLLAQSIDKLLPVIQAIANQAMAQQGMPVEGQVQIRRQKVGTSTRNWIVDLPKGLVPPEFGKISPSFRIGDKTLVFGMNPKTVADILNVAEGRGKKFEFVGKYANLAPSLPANMAMVQVRDDSQSLPASLALLPSVMDQLKAQMAAAGKAEAFPIKINPRLIPKPQEMQPFLKPAMMTMAVTKDGLVIESRDSVPTVAAPAVAAVLTSLLLPAVQSAREAARRAQCINNFKQFGLAMHNAHDSKDRAFPKQAITDKDGKPLLSWRVAILPYLEEGELYKQFHLDEPWDSPHNKSLISKMPKSYACPSHSTPPGMTTYMAVSGKGTMFEPNKGTSLASVLDGTSNTIMLVEGTEPVEWTKPVDIEYNPNDPSAMIGSRHPGGYNVLFADGSVRFLKLGISRELLKALFSKSGGEVVDPQGF
ncbi:MAG: DUF1559 domain-containing protein [Planctomycetota bacterium]